MTLRLVLATANPVIAVVPTGDTIVVTYKSRQWVFPVGDCKLLPIENTTAELIARYIAGRLVVIEKTGAFRQMNAEDMVAGLDVREYFFHLGSNIWHICMA